MLSVKILLQNRQDNSSRPVFFVEVGEKTREKKQKFDSLPDLPNDIISLSLSLSLYYIYNTTKPKTLKGNRVKYFEQFSCQTKKSNEIKELSVFLCISLWLSLNFLLANGNKLTLWALFPSHLSFGIVLAPLS